MGMRCRIRRNPITLTLCGYVGVPTGNLLWGLSERSDDSVLLINAESCWRELDEHIHGGLTYAQEDDDGWWWFGFDTAHAEDFTPATVELLIGLGRGADDLRFQDCMKYKTWEFVDDQIYWLGKRLWQYNEYHKNGCRNV
jgi:hypothetical protein